MVAGNSHETAKVGNQFDISERSNAGSTIARCYNHKNAKTESSLCDPEITRRAAHFPFLGQGDDRPLHLPMRQISHRSLDVANLEDDKHTRTNTLEKKVIPDDMSRGTITAHTGDVHIGSHQALRDTMVKTSEDFPTNKDHPLNLPVRQAGIWSQSLGSFDSENGDTQKTDASADKVKTADVLLVGDTVTFHPPTKNTHHNRNLRDMMKRASEFSILEGDDMPLPFLGPNTFQNCLIESCAIAELPFSARFAMAEFELPLDLPSRQLSEQIMSGSLQSFSSVGSPAGNHSDSFQSNITSFASFEPCS